MSDAIAERTETAKISILRMGSPIPDWLLVADPQVAGAPKGNWRFDVDVSIVELTDDIIVFPVLPFGEPSSARILDMTGIGPHHIYAATKPVRIIHMVNTFFPFEYTAAVAAKQMEVAQRAAAGATVISTRTDTHTVSMPVLHGSGWSPPRGFWARLKAALFGIG